MIKGGKSNIIYTYVFITYMLRLYVTINILPYVFLFDLLNQPFS